MEKNQYIPVMIQSLKKKSEILDTIMINIRMILQIILHPVKQFLKPIIQQFQLFDLH